MQAIVTKFHGATNVRGSRMSATYDGGRVFMGYDSGLSPYGNHKAVAQKLCDKLGWEGRYEGGGMSDGRYAWVYVPTAEESSIAPHVVVQTDVFGVPHTTHGPFKTFSDAVMWRNANPVLVVEYTYVVPMTRPK